MVTSLGGQRYKLISLGGQRYKLISLGGQRYKLTWLGFKHNWRRNWCKPKASAQRQNRTEQPHKWLLTICFVFRIAIGTDTKHKPPCQAAVSRLVLHQYCSLCFWNYNGLLGVPSIITRMYGVTIHKNGLWSPAAFQMSHLTFYRLQQLHPHITENTRQSMKYWNESSCSR